MTATTTHATPVKPGNPFARDLAERRRAVLSRFTPAALARMADKLIELADKGHVPAIRLAYAYGIGLPTKVVEPDRMDIDEWKLYRDESACLQDAVAMMQSPGVAGPLTCLRALRPILDENFFEQMMAELRREPSSDGKKRRRAPSPNGGSGRSGPLPNGSNGAPVESPHFGLDPASVSVAGSP